MTEICVRCKSTINVSKYYWDRNLPYDKGIPTCLRCRNAWEKSGSIKLILSRGNQGIPGFTYINDEICFKLWSLYFNGEID